MGTFLKITMGHKHHGLEADFFFTYGDVLVYYIRDNLYLYIIHMQDPVLLDLNHTCI